MRNRWRVVVRIGLVCVLVGARSRGLGAAPAETASRNAAQTPHNNVRKAREGNAGVPTVEQATAFLDDAERRLLDLGIKQQQAAWVEENFITVDTEALAADAGEAANTLSV